MILRERYVKQPTAGAVSWNTYSDLRGHTEQLCVNPSVATTTYDLSMTNDNGDTIYSHKGLKGTFVDDAKIGIFGIHTIAINNASSSNESFTITLLWAENP